MDEQGDPLEQLWRKVDLAWDDPAAHTRFLELARTSGRLGEAAARYRRLREHDVRGELARAKLGAIALLAVSSLEATRTEPAQKLPLSRGLLLSLPLLLLAMYATYLALRG